MKDFREYINEINTDKPVEALVSFFIDNEWFGQKFSENNGHITLSDAQIELFNRKLETFLNGKPDDLYDRF